MNRRYRVSPDERTIFAADRPVDNSAEPQPPGYLEQLCILAYLINCKPIDLAGKLIKPQALPGGEFFFRGSHSLPFEQLTQAFGDKPQLLYKAGQTIGAKKCDIADACIELAVLPKVPLTLVIWAGDDEFEPRSSILFDKTAAEQMPLDALMAAVNIAVKAVINAASVAD